MTEVIHADIKVTPTRVGTVTINHEGLVVRCDICVYKNEKLWVRMPEYWITPESKVRICYWGSKELSDEKQVFILNKVFDMTGLDLQRAVKEKQAYWQSQKEKRIDKTRK